MTARITSYSHDGLTFDVVDEGPLDGEVVVLLHGFPERAACWRFVTPILHQEGFRTIAPDQRGYSPGARPRRRRDYAIQHLVGDIAKLVDVIGRPVHIVAHDWGSVVAWYHAGSHPEQVRTLTALAVPHPDAYSKALRGAQLARSLYIAFFQLPWLPEIAARRPGGLMDQSLLRGGMTADELASFRRDIVEYGALPGGLAWYRALAFSPRRRARVSVPTTMLWSDGDDFIDRRGIDDCQNYVDGPYELAVLKGVTHWMPTQAPEAVSRVILDRVTGASRPADSP
jgi:pimeloyl-ACP methyl ester carboxylesterase